MLRLHLFLRCKKHAGKHACFAATHIDTWGFTISLGRSFKGRLSQETTNLKECHYDYRHQLPGQPD